MSRPSARARTSSRRPTRLRRPPHRPRGLRRPRPPRSCGRRPSSRSGWSWSHRSASMIRMPRPPGRGEPSGSRTCGSTRVRRGKRGRQAGRGARPAPGKAAWRTPAGAAGARTRCLRADRADRAGRAVRDGRTGPAAPRTARPGEVRRRPAAAMRAAGAARTVPAARWVSRTRGRPSCSRGPGTRAARTRPQAAGTGTPPRAGSRPWAAGIRPQAARPQLPAHPRWGSGRSGVPRRSRSFDAPS